MAKKHFVEGKIEEEFDTIVNTFVFLLPSVFLICGGLLALAFYPIKPYFYISIVIGIVWYFIPLNKVGWDTIDGFLIQYAGKKDKMANDNKATARRNVNFHLSLSLFLIVMTAVLIAGAVGTVHQYLRGFDPSVLADINTVVVIADSILAILIATELKGLQKRVLITYQILLIGIFIAVASLLIQALGFPFPALLMATIISAFTTYFLFSVFLYQTKTLLKNPNYLMNSNPASQPTKQYGHGGI